MEMEFPDGRDGPVAIIGKARDIVTLDPGAAPRLLADDRLNAVVAPDKRIHSTGSDPEVDAIRSLVGEHAIAGFRARVRPLFSDAALADRPLLLLLDDMVGCNIISTWVWTKWVADRAELIRWVGDPAPLANACIGYRPGASGLASYDYFDKIDIVPALGRADDPHAFHPLQADRDQTMRRVRRIDLWREGDRIAIDAMFQDSGVIPGGRRSAVHEYRLTARADARTMALLEIEALPGALPHPECLAAPASVEALVRQPLHALRADVLTRLRGTAGCTHLNDAARALAEVPVLAKKLP